MGSHSWRGKLLVSSISAASGAISAAENRIVVSRMASTVSPRPKSSRGPSFGMVMARTLITAAAIRKLKDARLHDRRHL